MSCFAHPVFCIFWDYVWFCFKPKYFDLQCFVDLLRIMEIKSLLYRGNIRNYPTKCLGPNIFSAIFLFLEMFFSLLFKVAPTVKSILFKSYRKSYTTLLCPKIYSQPAFKANNRNTRKRCEIQSHSLIKTPVRCYF